jgi:hypothetical protein
MTLNEGIIVGDTRVQMKSEMLRQLAHLKETTPDLWERAVFESLTGHSREDVDWDIPDNQAGYYTWIRSFDQLINELEDDGYVRSVNMEGNRKVLKKTDWDPSVEYSELVYPSGENRIR